MNKKERHFRMDMWNIRIDPENNTFILNINRKLHKIDYSRITEMARRHPNIRQRVFSKLSPEPRIWKNRSYFLRQTKFDGWVVYPRAVTTSKIKIDTLTGQSAGRGDAELWLRPRRDISGLPESSYDVSVREYNSGRSGISAPRNPVKKNGRKSCHSAKEGAIRPGGRERGRRTRHYWKVLRRTARRAGAWGMQFGCHR